MKRNMIWDLDGTLADGAHRQHFLDDYRPRKWDEYYACAGADCLHEAVAELYRALLQEGYKMHIISGRREDTRDVTIGWLLEHGLFHSSLTMRAVGDHTQDDILKLQMARERKLTPQNVLLVFEDRKRCVDAWRNAGFICFQVAKGDF